MEPRSDGGLAAFRSGETSLAHRVSSGGQERMRYSGVMSGKGRSVGWLNEERHAASPS